MPLTVPHWFSPHRYVKIGINPKDMKKSPLGHEVVICRDIGGERQRALVPTHFVDEVAGTVQAAVVGQIGDSLFISFPATSEGTATWIIRKELLSGILSEA